MESALLSADGATFDVRLGQPANISPDPDQVLSQTVWSDGLGGSDGLGATLATACSTIFSSSTIAMLGKNHKYFVVSSRHVHVVLGHGCSLRPSSQGSLHASLQPKDSGASVSSEEIVFTVTGLLGKEAPLSGGIVGPSEIGPCEAARFELIMMSLHATVMTEWRISTDSDTVSESWEFRKLKEVVCKECGISLLLKTEDLPVLHVSFLLQIRIVTVLRKTVFWSHKISRTD